MPLQLPAVRVWSAPAGVVHLPVGLSSYGEAHRAKPNPHAPAEHDFARRGSDRLALKEEQNEARIAAKGKAEWLALAVDAALDEHGEVVAFPAPGDFCLWLVGQRGQGETGVGEPNLFGIIAEDLVCRFNYLPFVFGQRLSARFLNAILDNESVDLSHVAT